MASTMITTVVLEQGMYSRKTRKSGESHSSLYEKQRRLIAAADAKVLGRGGVAMVARATGMSKPTIQRGLTELRSSKMTDPERVRQQGGGRKKIEEKFPEILQEIEALVDPASRGDPESPLRWTCKSTRELASAIASRGLKVGYRTVARVLSELGYSLQGNAKTLEGKCHPDRDKQFQFINDQVKQRLKKQDPVISVDTRKIELVGQFKNGGKEWMPEGRPEKVSVYDFLNKEKGKAIPYGIYYVGKNLGWGNVGADHDTATFAVESIRRWWYGMGASMYSQAKTMLICADGGGSNGSRLRLWKFELQNFADEIGMDISVCHFPPGTSKWNKIEHRLFSQISMNWRGRSLVSHEVVVDLISATKTKNGLSVTAVLDENKYPLKTRISNPQMAEINLKRKKFHGEWNYTICPKCK